MGGKKRFELWFEYSDFEMIEKACIARNLRVSEYIREAIFNHLDKCDTIEKLQKVIKAYENILSEGKNSSFRTDDLIPSPQSMIT